MNPFDAIERARHILGWTRQTVLLQSLTACELLTLVDRIAIGAWDVLPDQLAPEQIRAVLESPTYIPDFTEGRGGRLEPVLP